MVYLRRWMEMVKNQYEENGKRIVKDERDLNIEIKETIVFLDQACAYYDKFLQQYSPPEEQSFDEILEIIRQEFKEIVNIVTFVFELKLELPYFMLRDKSRDTLLWYNNQWRPGLLVTNCTE
uniref:Uncharacterized protein n=1 Tax=Heterorhabditis bacteriophora TaxID=37862 RepID=A0A1I7WC87_HETBA